MLNELLRIIEFIIQSLFHIWPLLLLTVPLSVIIKEIGVSSRINELLSKNIWLSILIATLIGAIAPFCSCSVIPIISSMLISGVPIAPVMAFWLASPSMDPEIYFLSVASLGWTLATARILATFLMSVVGGIVTHLILGKQTSPHNLLKAKAPKLSSCGCGDSESVTCRNGEATENSTCYTTSPRVMKTSPLQKIRSIAGDSLTSIAMISRFLVIAYTLEAIILFYIPDSLVMDIFSSNRFLSVINATFIGIPLYTTNLSALGIMSGLLSKGLSQGAALAFLVAGATTTLPAMTAVYNLVDRKIFALYLGITFVSAIGSGLIYELLHNLYTLL